MRHMRMRTGILVVLPLAAAALLSAQEPGTETEGAWKAEAALALAMARGNTNTSNFSLTVQAEGRLHDRIEWKNRGFILLARESGNTTAESFGLETRLQWEHSQRFFTFLEVNGLRDRFKNWAYRLVPAAGGGVVLINRELMSFQVDAGISGIFTEYLDSAADDSFLGVRLGDQWSWKISEGAELKQTLSINTGLADPERYFFRLEIGLTSRLTRSWSVQITFVDLFDNRPVGEDIKKNDMALMAGFSMKF